VKFHKEKVRDEFPEEKWKALRDRAAELAEAGSETLLSFSLSSGTAKRHSSSKSTASTASRWKLSSRLLTGRQSTASQTFSSNSTLSDALGIAEKPTPQERRTYFDDPASFPVYFAYYFPEYIKYPFADFHFTIFADLLRLLNGDNRELGWIMCRESAQTSTAKAFVVYLIATKKHRYITRRATTPRACSSSLAGASFGRSTFAEQRSIMLMLGSEC
jgi:hypothetical protein